LKEVEILLIDDDIDDRELFQIALDDCNISARCTAVESCEEALAELISREILPDFIFLDLNMPKMDGRECLTELKKTIRISDIPVVIFSTSTDDNDKKDTAAMGALEFISKPARVSELTIILKNFLCKQVNYEPNEK
jgi:CheY-like chemotaxis protein